MGAYGGEQEFVGAYGCSKNRKLWMRGRHFGLLMGWAPPVGLGIQAQIFSVSSGKAYGGIHIYKSSLIVRGYRGVSVHSNRLC